MDGFRVAKKPYHKIDVINIEVHQGSAAVGGVEHRGSCPFIKASYRLEYWQKVQDTVLMSPISFANSFAIP